MVFVNVGYNGNSREKTQEAVCGARAARTVHWIGAAEAGHRRRGRLLFVGVGEKCPSHRLLSAARLSPHRRKEIGGGHHRVSGSAGTVTPETGKTLDFFPPFCYVIHVMNLKTQ